MMEFPPFRLDTVNQCLWRRREAGPDERVLLTPKAFAVLHRLLKHAGRLDAKSPRQAGRGLPAVTESPVTERELINPAGGGGNGGSSGCVGSNLGEVSLFKRE